MNLITLFQTVSANIRDLFVEAVPGWGRGVDLLNNWQDNPDKIDQTDIETYHDLSVSPYIYAGLRARSIARLWTSATGIGDKDSGEAYAEPQIIYPPYVDESRQDDEQLAFVRYCFDEALNNPFNAILWNIQHAYMTYGRAITEIMWSMQEKGEWEGKVIFNDLLDKDPERFTINPPQNAPGIYLKDNVYNNTATVRMPDRKFLLTSQNAFFQNYYGLSDLHCLNSRQYQLSKILDFSAKGLERSGVGSYVGKYSEALSGKNSKDKRDEFLEQLQKLKSDTITIMYGKNGLEQLKADIDHEGFEAFTNRLISLISLVTTGSPTTLLEMEVGSYAKEESTGVRSKSELEQEDAALIQGTINFQLIPWLLDMNFADVNAYPVLQLIAPDKIQPTISERNADANTESDMDPDGEERESIEAKGEDEEDIQENALVELAEDEETEGDVKKKPRDTTFPDKEPEPDIYFEVEEAAREYLKEMPVLNYHDVNSSNQADIFTVKRLRSYSDSQAIQEALLAEIIKTIGAKTEDEAWNKYITAARGIFKKLGITLNASFESDLIISFRQARQRAYQRGIDALIESKPEGLTGVQFLTRDDKRVRPIHGWWDNVVLAPDDPRVQKTRCPADFGCRCIQMPVFNNEKPLTPEKDIPGVFPGETYRGYA